MEEKFDPLKLENQMCFPLYVCSKEIIRAYTPLLEKLDLTYTQYIAMMVLWDKKEMSVKDLGEVLYLDSGTLTPLLKKLETKGYLNRCRSCTDERSTIITITSLGLSLKEKAADIPGKLMCCDLFSLSPDEIKLLKGILDKMLIQMKK